MNNEFVSPQSAFTLLTMANAVELASALTRDVAGGEIASRLTTTSVTLHELSVSEIRKNLALGV